MSAYASAARRADAESESSRPRSVAAAPAGVPRYLQARAEPSAGQQEPAAGDDALEGARPRTATAGAADGPVRPGDHIVHAGTPPEVAALARLTAAPAPPVPRFLRAPAEARLGADLAAARLHAGPQATSQLRGLRTPAAALGRHIFLSSAAPRTLVPKMLTHELAHAAQAGLAAPDPARALRLGARDDALERDAARVAAGSAGLGVRGDANTLRLWDPGPTPGTAASWQDQAHEHREAERRRRARWERSVEANAPEILAAQPATLSEAILQSERGLVLQRVAMFEAVQRYQLLGSTLFGWLGLQPIVPVDLLERWASADRATLLLRGMGEADPHQFEFQDQAQGALIAFLETLVPVLQETETRQRSRMERERAEAERANEMREAILRDLRGDPMGGRAAAAGYSLANPRRDYYRAPPPASPRVQRSLARLRGESAPLDRAGALADFATATRAMDRMLTYLLGPSNDEARAFTYQEGLLERQRRLAERQPYARPIAAVFYPELELIDVGGSDGTRERVARGIPWQLYLYHTGFHGYEVPASAGGEWVLEDLMAVDRTPENREPSTDMEAAMLQQGAVVDPPWALFQQLDSKLRFSRGRLEVELPSRRRRTLRTTQQITLSGFLTGLGIALAALGLILFTGGAGTPAAIAFVAAAAAGVGSTLAELQEKAEQGLLTERDVNQAMLFIAADIASALTAGLGRVAAISARAVQLGRGASLIGRYVVPLQRAARTAQVAGTALDLASAAVVTGELIRQAELIQASQMSADEKEQALGRLVLTGLLTVSLTTVSVAGDVADLAARRTGFELDVDDAGHPLLRAAEPPSAAGADSAARSTVAGGPRGGPPAASGRHAADLPPARDPNSPEHLFAMLEQGIDPSLPPPGRAATGDQGLPSRSTVAAGIVSPEDAYRAYNRALAVADGREVAIYYNRRTRRYMVRIGTETEVAAFGEGWVTLLHFHPNPTGALTFRLPAPGDFEGLIQRSLNGPVREFIEFDIPGGGRGRTEFGIDLDAAEPVFVRIHYPNGEQQTIRFSDDGDYAAYWGERAVYVEPGSPTHRQMLDNISHWLREQRAGGSGGRSGPATSSMAGLGSWFGILRGRIRAARLRRAGAALPEGPLADEQMLAFLRQAEQHPLRRHMRRLAAVQGNHPGPGSPLTMEQVEELLEAFRAETGMRVVVTRRASGVNLRPGRGGGAEGQIRIEEGIRSSPEVLFAELSHDINAYLGSRTQRLPLRDMPELASLPGSGGMIDPRAYFHAGRILDYATFRGIPVEDAIAEIARDPVRALFRLEEWIDSVKRRGR